MTSFGKIYRQKEFRQTAIGRIPAEWEIARLDDLCEVVGGATPSTSVKGYWNGEIPFVTPTDVTELEDRNLNFLNDTKVRITKQGLKNSSAKLLPPGTVLVTSRATIGYAAINDVPVATNQGFASLICNKQVDNIWILYLMRFLRSKLESLGAGSTYKEVSRGTIRNLTIALPTKTEQEKIGRVLSSVEEAIQKTNEIIAKTERLKKGLMQQFLTEGLGHKEFKDTEIGRIPKEWEVVRLGDRVTLQRGYDLPDKQRKDGQIPVIGSNGIVGYHSTSMAKGPGVIIGRSGTLGKVYYSETDYWPLNTSLFVKKFTRCHPRFVYYLFQNLNFKQFSAGTSVPTLNRNLVHPAKVAFPRDLKEQRKIAETFTTVDKKLELERKEKAKLEKAKRGLMDLLLTGKIRIRVD